MSIELSPGIAEPICGWEWLAQHRNDLDGWRPTIELISEHSTFRLSGTPNAVKEAIHEYVKGRRG